MRHNLFRVTLTPNPKKPGAPVGSASPHVFTRPGAERNGAPRDPPSGAVEGGPGCVNRREIHGIRLRRDIRSVIGTTGLAVACRRQTRGCSAFVAAEMADDRTGPLRKLAL